MSLPPSSSSENPRRGSSDRPVAPEIEPTEAEWEQLAASLAALGIDPEEGGPAVGGADPSAALDPGEARFLRDVVELDRNRARRLERHELGRRQRCLEALGTESAQLRNALRRPGWRLALAYARLRFRESRALRVAGLLLFAHLLAMPVVAMVRPPARPTAPRNFEPFRAPQDMPSLSPEREFDLPAARTPAEVPEEAPSPVRVGKGR